MDKIKAKELQKTLCLELNDYYQSHGFGLNRKEWDFVRKNIVVPYFLMTTKGNYISIRPCIINKSNLLLEAINSIVGTPILNNGIFVAGNKLNYSLNITNLDLPHGKKVHVIADMYYLRFSEISDISWMVQWIIAFMEEVGWNLVNQLSGESDTYSLYKNLFEKYLENIGENSGNAFRLDFGSHATMIFLGYKNQEDGADELVSKTIKHFENSLFVKRALEIQRFFKNQRQDLYS